LFSIKPPPLTALLNSEFSKGLRCYDNCIGFGRRGDYLGEIVGDYVGYC